MDRSNSQFFDRFAASLVTDALSAVPVIVVVGPRGVGKTTLVRTLDGKDRKYVSLDDEADLEATRYDPMGFVRRFDRVTIDEVERAPDLLRAIEQSVDSDPRPGRFLLTASANLLSQNDLPPGLASRSEVVTLLPLSQAEIDRQEQSFLKNAFTGNLIEPRNPLIGNELLQTVLTGGYPEMLRRPNFRRRQSWTRDYLKGVFQRDVPEAAAVQKTHELPRLLQVLALHSGQLTNFAQIGAQLGIDDKTTQKYTAVLEQLFLVHRVPAWFQSRLNRLVKTPRLHFLDSGLLAAMLGLAPEKAAENRPAFAALLQTFVLAEILNQITWSDDILTLHHYRDKDRDEVNFLVEHEDGALVGIHVKPGATVYAPDFKGLQKVQNACGEHLKLGVVLYDGTRTVPFGDRLLAAPISCLWS